MKRLLCLAVLALPAPPNTLPAQPIRSTTVGTPTASFPEPFSRVAGVREQSDGRLVVLDGIEARILLVDFRATAPTPIGRAGRGPAEYTLPIALVALAADTTLAVDMTGGGRALVITRNGAESNPLRSARIQPGTPLFTRTDVQADALGRLYELVPRVRAVANRQVVEAMSGVRRLDRRSGTLDTLGELSLLVRSPLIRTRPTSNSASGAPQRASGGPMPPFATVDQWAVASDGRVAFVTVDPYRVSFLAASGERVDGPTLRFDPVTIDHRLKDQWRSLRQQPVPSLSYGPNGIAAGRTKPRFIEPTEWPSTLPPFLPSALRFAPDGMLWIERTTAADQAQTFDLIDRKGVLTRRITLPLRTRLVGFGVGVVYTVRIDDEDLEYLQRHPLPN